MVKTKFYVPNLILFYASSPRSLRFVSAFDRAVESLKVNYIPAVTPQELLGFSIFEMLYVSGAGAEYELRLD